MQTITLNHPPAIVSWAAVGGKEEKQGPLGQYFDELTEDSFWGRKTWEQAESELQARCLRHALRKGGLTEDDLNVCLGGDLTNQCVATTFALRSFPVPLLGIYGACSTMGEGLLLSALLLSGGQVNMAGVMVSSHFCTAERQYRMPVPYGSQRSPTAQWTATAAGCALLSRQGDGPRIAAVCPGRVVDMGITDATNMGAAMAPAAADTIAAIFRDTGTKPADYSLIVTGDLGQLGHDILVELMAQEGYDMSRNYTDCGLLLFDRDGQDMHCGGSGAGCSAAVLCSYLLPRLHRGELKRVLFAPTGALLSPTTSFQGESIPGICHGVVIEHGVS